jgi:hypothetical protein
LHDDRVLVECGPDQAVRERHVGARVLAHEEPGRFDLRSRPVDRLRSRGRRAVRHMSAGWTARAGSCVTEHRAQATTGNIDWKRPGCPDERSEETDLGSCFGIGGPEVWSASPGRSSSYVWETCLVCAAACAHYHYRPVRRRVRHPLLRSSRFAHSGMRNRRRAFRPEGRAPQGGTGRSQVGVPRSRRAEGTQVKRPAGPPA